MKKIFSLILLAILISGCSPKMQENNAPRELNVYNWEDYFAPDTISNFEKEFNVKVNLYTFDDEAFMESDVQSNPGKYDFVIASGSLIREMTQLKLLSGIDYNNIPNFKNINPRFKNPSFDPENAHSVPYMWGTTGVLIDTKYIPQETDSLSVLWDKKYSGKMSMLNSKEEVVIFGLKYLGYSVNEDDMQRLEAAKEALIKQKPLIRGYEDPITIRDDMISEKLWAAQAYSGDAQYAIGKNPDLRYIIPKEGARIWTDSMAIPIDSKNKELAEEFINYILRPDVGAKIANYVRYASPNDASKESTDKDLLTDPSIYPSPDVEARLEQLRPNDKTVSEYNKIWSELQRK